MTLRPFAAWTLRNRALVVAFASVFVGVVALTGCDPRQAMYFLQPFEPKIPAKCPSLKGKRVVILTSAAAGLRTDYLNVDREIAKKLAPILKENIKKIDLVETSKVAQWSEGKPNWTDPTEAANAFEADIVIALEIREFQVQDPSSPGLFQGRSNINIHVVELAHPKDDKKKPMTDQPKEANTIYDDDIATIYPTTSHVPQEASLNPSVFKNRFMEIVVKELSWAFVEHAPGDNIHSQRFNE